MPFGDFCAHVDCESCLEKGQSLGDDLPLVRDVPRHLERDHTAAPSPNSNHNKSHSAELSLCQLESSASVAKWDVPPWVTNQH